MVCDYNSSLNIKAKYIMHPKRRDIPIIQKRNNTNYHYYRDGLGLVIALEDENADIKNTYKYYAFGSSRSKTETIPNRYQYTSREKDNENELYYYRSRTYNPIVGRFIQKDKLFNRLIEEDIIFFNLEIFLNIITIPGYEGTIQDIIIAFRKYELKNYSYRNTLIENIWRDEINNYIYVRNSPVNFTDPRGYSIICHIICEVICEPILKCIPCCIAICSLVCVDELNKCED